VNVIKVTDDSRAWQYTTFYPPYDFTVTVRDSPLATEVGELTVAKGTTAQTYTTYGFNGHLRWRVKNPDAPDILKEFLDLHGKQIPYRLWDKLKDTFPDLQKPVGWSKVIRQGRTDYYYESSCGDYFTTQDQTVFSDRMADEQRPILTDARAHPERLNTCIQRVGNLP
jgi:hypothetical protein